MPLYPPFPYQNNLYRISNIDLYGVQTLNPVVSAGPPHYVYNVRSYVGEYGDILQDQRFFVSDELPYQKTSTQPCPVTGGEYITNFNLLENGFISGGGSPCSADCQDHEYLYVAQGGSCEQKCSVVYDNTCSSYEWFESEGYTMCICCLYDGLPIDPDGSFIVNEKDLRYYPSEDQADLFASNAITIPDFEVKSIEGFNPVSFWSIVGGISAYEGGGSFLSTGLSAYNPLLAPLSASPEDDIFYNMVDFENLLIPATFSVQTSSV